MELVRSARSARYVSGISLVLVNLVPLFGVLILGWNVASLLWLYWLENVVVGAFNLVKMAQAQGVHPAQYVAEEYARRVLASDETQGEGLRMLAKARAELGARDPRLDGVLGLAQKIAQKDGEMCSSPTAVGLLRLSEPFMKVFAMLFFITHYRAFMLGHGVFLSFLFGQPKISLPEMLLMTFLLVSSHGISYIVYFILRGEHQSITTWEQMGRPYGRVFVMHMTIIVGGMVIMAIGTPLAALSVLVVLKAGIDLYSHIRSHARYETALTGAVA